MKKRKWLLPWICVGCLITGIFLSFYVTYFYTNKGQLDSLAICFSKIDQIQAICITLHSGCRICLWNLYIAGKICMECRYRSDSGRRFHRFLQTQGSCIRYSICKLSVKKQNGSLYAYGKTFDTDLENDPTGCFLVRNADRFSLCCYMQQSLCFVCTAKAICYCLIVAALSLGMIFGKTPGVVSVVWLVLGSVGLFVWMSREERGVKGVKKVTFWQKEYSDKSIFCDHSFDRNGSFIGLLFLCSAF